MRANGWKQRNNLYETKYYMKMQMQVFGENKYSFWGFQVFSAKFISKALKWT